MKGKRERQSRKDNKGRILKKGEGQDKSGRYYFTYTDKDGKRRKIYDADLVALREKATEIQKMLANGIDVSAGKRTLNEQFERYLKTKDIRESTMSNYKSLWNRGARDTIGKMKIIDIKKSDLQMFYKSLKDKGLADGTIKIYGNNLIGAVMEAAVDDDIILKNPNKGCMKEYTDKPKEKEILTIDQQEAFLKFVSETPKYEHFYPMLQVMFSTALRCSEIIGLTWDEVDFEKRMICIRHQLLYANYGDGYKHHYREPKTNAGLRNLPMSQKCYKALKKQKEYQFALGIDRDKNVDGLKGFVFTTTSGKPYTSQGVIKIIQRISSKFNEYERNKAAVGMELPKMSCHTLRHTGCTRLAETKMDIKSLQEFMGHSDINVTMDIYNHVDTDRMKKEIENAEKQSKVI